jgi:hypothetical protein
LSLLTDNLRSLQDDKESGAFVAGSFIALLIRFLPEVGLTRIVVDLQRREGKFKVNE